MTALDRKALEAVKRHPDRSDAELARQLGVRERRIRRARRQLAAEPSEDSAAASLSEGRIGRFLEQLVAPLDDPAIAWALLVGLGALVTWSVMLPVSNPDLGWHLALGRWIFEQGAVPTADPFSHTAPGTPMVAHEWLTQALYHGVAALGGVLGLRWMHAGVAVGLLVGLYLWLRRQQVTPLLAWAGSFLYFVIAHTRFHVRPHLLSTALLMGLYAYVFVRRPPLSRRQLVTIWAVVVIWANAHSSVLLFAVLVCAYTAVELGLRWLGLRRAGSGELGEGRPARLLALSSGCLLAVFATPNHLRLIPYMLTSRDINARWSREWAPLLDYWGDPRIAPLSVEACLLVGLLTLVVVLLSLRRRPAGELAVVTLLALLPLSSQRFVSVYFAPIAFLLTALQSWLDSRSQRRFAQNCAVVCALAAALAATWPVFERDIVKFRGRLSAEWNFRYANFPVAAMSLLEDLDLSGKLYTYSDWGGYVLHRTHLRYPIFIDGRWVTLGEDILRDSLLIQRLRSRAFELLQDYGIEILLVKRGFIGRDDPERETWVPVFENLNSGLYLSRGGENFEANMRACALYYQERGIPFSELRGFDERAAFEAQPEWSAQFKVERHHMRNHRWSDRPREGDRLEAGW